MPRAALALPLLLAATPAAAAVEDTQAWEQLNLVIPVAPKVRATLEQIARVSDRQGGLYTTEFGGLLGWGVAKGVELGLGYRHVAFHNRNTGRDEERLRQQVVLTRGHFAGRLRLDERFHPAGDEIGFRVRPLLRYNLPLRARGWSLFASHESFFLANTTAWGQRAGYERMRNLLGVGLPVAKGISADAGYLNQYRFARGAARATMDHALSVQLTVNLSQLTAPRLHD